MPNWVINRLSISGDKAEEIMKSISTYREKSQRTDIDFNKIIPMPKELEIISGGSTDDCIEVYLTSINPLADYYGEEKMEENEFKEFLTKFNKGNFHQYNASLPLEKINEIIKDTNESKYESYADIAKIGALQYGKNAVDNFRKYGSKDWYDWSCRNWGSKWNACDCNIDSTSATFETAWSPVHQVILKLSELYPDHQFSYEYAEEQPGYFAGSYVFENGEAHGEDYAEYEKEAFEMYFDLWGNDERFVFNDKTNTYDFVDETETENEM